MADAAVGHRELTASGKGAARPEASDNEVVNPDRARLAELSQRLTRLHTVLLERERRAYEDAHGPISPRELLQLLLADRHFQWLRALSGMITRIDAALGGKEPVTAESAEALLREAERLLRSGEWDAFGVKYREALQDSPSVVMAHADVVKVLPRRER